MNRYIFYMVIAAILLSACTHEDDICDSTTEILTVPVNMNGISQKMAE